MIKKAYADEDFRKVIQIFSYKLLKSLQQAGINWIETALLVNIL